MRSGPERRPGGGQANYPAKDSAGVGQVGDYPGEDYPGGNYQGGDYPGRDYPGGWQGDYPVGNYPEGALSVDCQWSSWSSPLSCSKSCGGGKQLEIRHKTVIENHGGTCSGSFHLKIDCNTQSCPGRTY